MKTQAKNSLWYYAVNSLTILFYILIVLDFLTHNSLLYLFGPVSAIYIGALAIYSAEKEFKRWRDYYVGYHPGEVYVVVWTLIVIALLVLESIFPEYQIPGEIFSAYSVVIGILAITKRSKSNYSRKGKH